MRVLFGFAFLVSLCCSAWAQQIVDIPTRSGVTQRLLVYAVAHPKATLVMLPGGHGGLRLFPNGSMGWGQNNFLVRTCQLFVDQGFKVILVDAPSDRQSQPFLAGFRQRPEHLADLKAVIAWAREQAKVPVWLIGTSRGTQSAAYVATELAGDDAPDGVVLTASIVSDAKSRPVPAMPLGKITVPVLVVHHEQDECSHCPYSGVSEIVDKLNSAPRKELVTIAGGKSIGDPCQAKAYHGFNGVEPAVTQTIGSWILAR